MSVPFLPTSNPDQQQQLLLASQTINEILKGRANNAGEVTLTENVTSTTVEDNLFNSGMVPLLVPTTANAAAEIGAGTLYVSARENGSFTITHANNAQTDRTFIYVRWG